MQKYLVLALTLAACGKAEPQDQFNDLAGLDDKSDAFSSKLKLAGNLTYGAPPLKVKYSKTPLYRGVTFTGSVGDPVDIWVRSTVGDAVSWLLDSSYKVVAKNDDASSSTADSHLTATLSKAGTFYVVFRDYNYGSHYFTVEVDGPAAPAGCALTLATGGSNATLDSYASLLDSDDAGWQVFTRKLPSCVDFTNDATRTQLRETLRSAGFIDGGDQVQSTVIAAGGSAFTQLLDSSLAALHAKAGADAHADSLEGDIKRPVIATPTAFIEVRLTLDADECSESGAAMIDTRTGIVYVVRQLIPC